MERLVKRVNNFQNTLYLAWFLALAQLKRSSRATTLLIIFVMTLTFLNLILVRGLLVGLIQGIANGYHSKYAGDILISTNVGEDYIEHSPQILETLRALPQVKALSYRYSAPSQLEGSYRNRTDLNDDPDLASAIVLGVDPDSEEATTHIKDYLAEGRFLTSADTEGIVLGANILRRYLDIDNPNVSLLERAEVGDKIRLDVNGERKEMEILGILKSKNDYVDFRAFVLDKTLRPLIGRDDYNVNEIAVVLKPGESLEQFEEILNQYGFDKFAKIQTWEESMPKAVLDVQKTFALLGNIIGSIGLVAAAITIFIVIFINAITRRKYIGILKGIGINERTIEAAYVVQSFFYALIGIAIGTVLLYGLIVPYVNVHPLRFPFADGVVAAEFSATAMRIILLLLSTLVAGYIPARLVVTQNTLNAILGRK